MEQAVQIFKSAVAAVQPAQLLQQHLIVRGDSFVICGQDISASSVNNIYVIGAGKAAAAMAIETEKILGDSISEGIVTTKYEHALPSCKIKVIEAAHPVPDEKGIDAVLQTIQLLKKVTENDVIICLLSGGASALWCDVPSGITLQEVQITFDQLIKSGAAIHEINIVRKHLSNVKGGQLIRHCGGAKVFSLIISDVPGDELAVIASGPTVADVSSFADAQNILSKYNLLSLLPASIRQHITQGMQGIIADTPKPGGTLFNNTVNKIIGSNLIALMAAAKQAEALGYYTVMIDQLATGNVELEAEKFMRFAIDYTSKKPVCILQGGETTVKVTGTGKGGRNQHFALLALQQLSKQTSAGNITILSGGTDGTDGPTDAAGAIINNETLEIALRKNLSIEPYLANQDAYHFFQQTNSLLITGPTQTNVMDIMIAIVK